MNKDQKSKSATSGAFVPGPQAGWKLPYLRLTTLLIQQRDALGLTQEDAAPLLGVSRRTLQRWEAGEVKPDGPTLFFWAACLGIEIASHVAHPKEGEKGEATGMCTSEVSGAIATALSKHSEIPRRYALGRR